jgi:hypothetical protein
MTNVYDILEKIKDLLIADVDVNTVTTGDIADVALGKSTMYSLSHIMLNNVTDGGNSLIFNVSVIAMDVVDITKESITDKFLKNDNEQDVLNTQLAVLVRMIEQLRRGDIRDLGYHLSGAPTYEPFRDRFEDKVAGWVATFNVETIKGMTICD